VWLIAHLDSKWQPVPMSARIAGVVVMTLAAIALVVELALGARGWQPVALVWVGGIPLLASFVGTRAHGTLDNASGVAAVLEAAGLVPRDGRSALGVLITDAEELALAGARAWTRATAQGSHAHTAIALNCDTIDDRGPLTVMHHRGRSRDLAARLERAAHDSGEPLRVIRLLPGVLTDGVALADAGWRAVTLSRGTLRTLDRIHTSRDTLASMGGTGIAGAARVLARTVVDIIGGELD
jgi:Zn-dependent M28 family amino/carboxypeptidase